ncbi:unnamed protein product [Diabrotica balteata]|uniref:Uncharacterized protein n=1 Tax=Diabrotica balteata TaxID=107213 RepID=A0A9N9SUJ0_DIABA|nr:unnamed protein product [Diabrotica balteata]
MSADINIVSKTDDSELDVVDTADSPRPYLHSSTHIASFLNQSDTEEDSIRRRLHDDSGSENSCSESPGNTAFRPRQSTSPKDSAGPLNPSEEYPSPNGSILPEPEPDTSDPTRSPSVSHLTRIHNHLKAGHSFAPYTLPQPLE